MFREALCQELPGGVMQCPRAVGSSVSRDVGDDVEDDGFDLADDEPVLVRERRNGRAGHFRERCLVVDRAVEGKRTDA